VKVTNEKIESRQAYLTIEMEPDEIEKSAANTYRKLVKQISVPGFRKGKAPRAVLERHVGKESMLREMMDDIIPTAYDKAVQEQELDPIAQPEIEVIENEPVTFKAVVPLKPQITLGDYQSTRLEPEAVDITDESVDAVIEQLRHQNAVWEPVERVVQFNDLVTLDVESTLDDEPFINQKGVQYQVIKDTPSPAPGFAEQLVDMDNNQSKTFEIEYPEDYQRSEVAGKKASFTVTISENKQENLPEVTDEFASRVEPEFTSVDVMRERILNDLKQRAEERVKREYEDKVIDDIAEKSQIEFPPIMVEVEIDQMINRNFQFLQQSGQSLEQYLQNINKTIEELREDMRPSATQRVTHALTLGKVAEEEKIEVTAEEIDNEIEEIVKNNTNNKEEMKEALNSQQNRNSIENTLITRKTIERIVEIASGSGSIDETNSDKEEN